MRQFLYDGISAYVWFMSILCTCASSIKSNRHSWIHVITLAKNAHTSSDLYIQGPSKWSMTNKFTSFFCWKNWSKYSKYVCLFLSNSLHACMCVCVCCVYFLLLSNIQTILLLWFAQQMLGRYHKHACSYVCRRSETRKKKNKSTYFKDMVIFFFFFEKWIKNPNSFNLSQSKEAWWGGKRTRQQAWTKK